MKKLFIVLGMMMVTTSAMADIDVDFDLDLDIDTGLWKCRAIDADRQLFSSGLEDDRFEARFEAMEKCYKRSYSPRSCEIHSCKQYRI